MIAGVGVHPQIGAAVFPGVVLIELHERRAVALSGAGGLHHQRVQHHHLLIRHVQIAPGHIGVHRHLDLIDAGRCHNRAVFLHHEQVIGLQRRAGRVRRGVYAPDPAYDGPAALLVVVDMLIDGRDMRDVLFGAFSDHGKALLTVFSYYRQSRAACQGVCPLQTTSPYGIMEAKKRRLPL